MKIEVKKIMEDRKWIWIIIASVSVLVLSIIISLNILNENPTVVEGIQEFFK